MALVHLNVGAAGTLAEVKLALTALCVAAVDTAANLRNGKKGHASVHECETTYGLQAVRVEGWYTTQVTSAYPEDALAHCFGPLARHILPGAAQNLQLVEEEVAAGVVR